MINVLSVENMRKSDAYTIENIVSGKELMFRAGKGVYESVEWREPVAIVCGKGNNAGDGYVVAKLLRDSHISCTVFLIDEVFSEGGNYYFDMCKASGVNVRLFDESEDFSSFSTILDCIFGTGFKGEVRGKARAAIEKINSSGAYVVSVDINSGLNGDNGMAEVCVISDLTLSIGVYKPGHLLNMAKDVIKEKKNLDIGISPLDAPYLLIEPSDLREFFKPRKNFSHKGTYGYIALIGGSKRYGGAIRLAHMANAAMRSGAGVVKLAVPNGLYHVIAPNILETTLFPLSDNDGEMVFDEGEIENLISNVKTVAFGMGIGVTEETAKALSYIVSHFTGALIIDADGLTLLSQMGEDIIKSSPANIILTPHLKEFSRLTGLEISRITASPIASAEEYARKTNAVVLLKGPSTIITDGRVTYISDSGCPGMATAGSGDVLSGILSAVCAYSPNLTLAAAAGAYINGKAGEAAQKKTNPISMTAGDTAMCIADAITEIIRD